MEVGFPKKCFITHSHKDEDALELLKKKLRNRGVESESYPPIKVPPEKLRCNPYIETILRYPALIYIKGGHSNLSFWVAFARDFALRAGKLVFSFDPVTLKIEKSRLKQLQLPIFPSYLSKDARKLQGLFKHLENRYIDLFAWQKSHIPPSEINPESIVASVSNGGYCVIFFTSKTVKSKMMSSEVKYALETHPERILIALLDDVRNKEIPGFSERTCIVPMTGKHRWDDLIVNIYWTIFHPSYKL
jgi:hypothetical protein